MVCFLSFRPQNPPFALDTGLPFRYYQAGDLGMAPANSISASDQDVDPEGVPKLRDESKGRSPLPYLLCWQLIRTPSR